MLIRALCALLVALLFSAGCSLEDPFDQGPSSACEAERCACNFGGQSAGVCANGRTEPGAPTACLAPPAYYAVEAGQCDGLDNDCDGATDEGCPCPLRANLGVCSIARRDEAGACADPALYEPDESACDGLDNDCDGTTDEECATCTYLGDTDGVCPFGVAREDSDECGPPSSWVADEADCASDPLGGDGVDNDCDGQTDEGCACDYLGSSQGVCALGRREGEACAAPSAYQEDESQCDKLDNDCDGQVDEGCDPGTPDAGTPDAGTPDAGAPDAGAPDMGGGETACDYLGRSAGVCGTAKIDQGSGLCGAPAGYAATEVCGDDIDNNCEGGTEEGCPCNYTGSNTGVCAGSSEDGQGACLEPSAYQADESACDDLDNDCDGVTDEGCACAYLDKTSGVCASSSIDAAGRCARPATYQTSESTCDGLNNDCDGVTDEKCPCPYLGKSSGVCAQGTLSASTNGACEAPSGYEAPEVTCTDNLDNDCDGQSDEGCPCNYLGSSVGECTGSTTIDGGACGKPATYRTTEICRDNLDNDCDGAIDEGCSCNFLGISDGICRQGLTNNSGDCVLPAGLVFQFQETLCNDFQDNDCDGQPDCGDSNCRMIPECFN